MEKISNIFDSLMYVNKEEEDEMWRQVGLAIARKEGYYEGVLEGLAEARCEENQKIIKTALQENIDVETIADITKVSVDEVLKIKDHLAK